MQVQKSYVPDGRGSGCLYLVATPIGNLEDMTYRAVRILKEADWIAAEDTRQTRKLLTHYDIHTKLVSYHEHNKKASGPELIRFILEGHTVALVSDAGLPAISDPGEDLVREAVDAGVPVIPVPGANAALSALIVSGLSTDGFRFAGFLPREKKDLKDRLLKLQQVPETLLFYESPYRVAKTCKAMLEVWGNRRIVLARELTKRYEEFARGTLEEAIHYLEEHEAIGEYCLVVEGASAEELLAARADSEWWREMGVEQHVEVYEARGMDRKEAMKQAAVDRGVSKRDIYQELNAKKYP